MWIISEATDLIQKLRVIYGVSFPYTKILPICIKKKIIYKGNLDRAILLNAYEKDINFRSTVNNKKRMPRISRRLPKEIDDKNFFAVALDSSPFAMLELTIELHADKNKHA